MRRALPGADGYPWLASAGVIGQRWSGNDRSPRRLGRVLMSLAESVDE
jgi:hypothetical protein